MDQNPAMLFSLPKRTAEASMWPSVSEAIMYFECETLPKLRRECGGGYYIGICNNPNKRLAEHKLNGYRKMIIIFIAVDSTLTSSFEVGVLDGRWDKDPRCNNNSAGGENPSPGFPHFCYAVTY